MKKLSPTMVRALAALRESDKLGNKMRTGKDAYCEFKTTTLHALVDRGLAVDVSDVRLIRLDDDPWYFQITDLGREWADKAVQPDADEIAFRKENDWNCDECGSFISAGLTYCAQCAGELDDMVDDDDPTPPTVNRFAISCGEIEHGGDIEASVDGITKAVTGMGGEVERVENGQDDDNENYLLVVVSAPTDEAMLEQAILSTSEVCIDWIRKLKASTPNPKPEPETDDTADLKLLAWMPQMGNDTTIDHKLANPWSYATKVHLVPPTVGVQSDGNYGEAGEALCGAKVPGPDGIIDYLEGKELDHPRAKRCKRCEAKARKLEGGE